MSSPDKFKQVEDEYFRLKGQLAVGRITAEQFDAALQALVLKDANGRAWMMGVDSAAWYVNEGGAWVQADPYAAPANPVSERPADLPERGAPSPPPPSPPPAYIAPPPSYPASPPPPTRTAPPPAPTRTAAPQQNRGGCGSLLVKGCLALVALVVCAAVAGFVAFQSGYLTPNVLLNLVGLGPATIQVTNFRDDPITVIVTPLRESEGSSSFSTDLTLNAFDVQSTHITNPGRVHVEFQGAQGIPALGGCTLTVRGGDQFQFVVLPERIVVNRENSPPSSGRDLIIETSSLCR
ncbi:MAG: hypothetical protein HY741_24075 [Chloroflexi bacterium]|nr:hypothetical protein [Chloroflexota bacterium]